MPGLLLYVRTCAGDLVPVDVDPSACVGDILASIPMKGRLMWQGEVLEASTELADVGIGPESQLELLALRTVRFVRLIAVESNGYPAVGSVQLTDQHSGSVLPIPEDVEVTSSGRHSSHREDRILESSGSYWYGKRNSGTQWIQLQFAEPLLLSKVAFAGLGYCKNWKIVAWADQEDGVVLAEKSFDPPEERWRTPETGGCSGFRAELDLSPE
eukprot:TRINITY_DN4989_c0_g1_i1.p1 TRINITY_DN4989_c0_g1~~TRINITY_DN4989_c0_g1_i1.p1  ORF type:complete len:234 (+),score=47.11 TRINITY_DN4989_c0_g1_i1:66-704(+)